MTPLMKWTGLIATIILVLVIPIYAISEPARQETISLSFRSDAVSVSTDAYAENCAVCHGAAGEGIGEMPDLNTDGVRGMEEADLFRVISRGRDNTLMAGWAVEEGGILSNAQVEDMITFLRYADWNQVETRVAELGLTPPEVVEMEVSEEMLTAVSSLPEGTALVSGLTLYAEKCAACHGPDGGGTTLAPAIDSAELRAVGAEEITRIINYGVPGTLMAGWENALDAQQTNDIVSLILRWPELQTAGVEFPEVEMVSIPSSPEMIADGAYLYSIACKSCHGTDAYGTRMAPALNNQTFLSETPDAAIYQIIAGGVPGTVMPAWGSRLTDEDISALVAYLRSLEPDAPPMANP